MEFGKGKESWKKEKARIENKKWKGRNKGEKEWLEEESSA